MQARMCLPVYTGRHICAKFRVNRREKIQINELAYSFGMKCLPGRAVLLKLDGVF